MTLFTVLALLMSTTSNVLLWIAFAVVLVLYLGRRRSRKTKEVAKKRAA